MYYNIITFVLQHYICITTLLHLYKNICITTLLHLYCNITFVLQHYYICITILLHLYCNIITFVLQHYYICITILLHLYYNYYYICIITLLHLYYNYYYICITTLFIFIVGVLQNNKLAITLIPVNNCIIFLDIMYRPTCTYIVYTVKPALKDTSI